MSVFDSMNVGVNGVNAQGNKIAAISDNISNTTTVGYKESEVNFKSMVNYIPTVFSGNAAGYNVNGARSVSRALVSAQGLFAPTNSVTDLAVSGNGLFVVSEDPGSTANLRYTRAGAFNQDLNGNLRNDAGFYLMGWRLDELGNLPLALQSDALDSGTAVASLEAVNLAQISDTPTPTTQVSAGMNLDASQQAYDPLQYDPADETMNMAGGTVPPHFERQFEIVDPAGVAHNFTMGFLKTGINTWAVEVYAEDITELGGTPASAQVANGVLTFNGDGTLASVSPALTGPLVLTWSNGAGDNSIDFNYGTAGPPFGTPGATVVGRSDGVSQLDSGYEFRFLDQNGTEVGNLDNITIDAEGYVIAQFDNASTRRLFKIPLAQFRDPSQLQAFTGNIYAETLESSSAFFSGTSQTSYGRIFPNSLEQSSVELEKQLTNLIIAQRAYQANTNTINTSDAMLQRLDEMLR